MPQNNPWLIIAQSGRALAVSAARAGYVPYVLDLYGDLDTVAVAGYFHQLEICNKEININKLNNIIDTFSRQVFAGVVVGSGLESHPEVLENISHHWLLYGNNAKTVMACKDPAVFFPLLDKLSIQHPEIATGQTLQDGNWLVKNYGGSGGTHISEFQPGQALCPGACLQRKIDGRTLSVVFLADGKNYRLVGFNEIWPLAPEQGDYRYLGAMTLPDLDKGISNEIRDIVSALVPALELQGLCGVDLIVDESGQCHVLEVNPRPTATIELHEHEHNLFEAHVLACQGKLLKQPEPVNFHAAHKVIYAVEDFDVPDVDWPIWVSDRPVPGTAIRQGDPVCTIHARAEDKDSILQELGLKTRHLNSIMPTHKLAA